MPCRCKMQCCVLVILMEEESLEIRECQLYRSIDNVDVAKWASIPPIKQTDRGRDLSTLFSSLRSPIRPADNTASASASASCRTWLRSQIRSETFSYSKTHSLILYFIILSFLPSFLLLYFTAPPCFSLLNSFLHSLFVLFVHMIDLFITLHGFKLTETAVPLRSKCTGRSVT